jgi:hypothetical protein
VPGKVSPDACRHHRITAIERLAIERHRQVAYVLTGEETLQREQRRYVFDDPYYRRWVQLNIIADLGLSVPG